MQSKVHFTQGTHLRFPKTIVNKILKDIKTEKGKDPCKRFLVKLAQKAAWHAIIVIFSFIDFFLKKCHAARIIH